MFFDNLYNSKQSSLPQTIQIYYKLITKEEHWVNYFHKLNQSHDTSVEVERGYLFTKLINEISFSQFEQHKEEVVEVVRSFQSERYKG